MKVVAALAAVVGAVYVVATYGDKIVAWAKDLCRRYGNHGTVFYMTDDDPADEPAEEEAAEEETAEEADPEQADDSDFEN